MKKPIMYFDKKKRCFLPIPFDAMKSISDPAHGNYRGFIVNNTIPLMLIPFLGSPETYGLDLENHPYGSFIFSCRRHFTKIIGPEESELIYTADLPQWQYAKLRMGALLLWLLAFSLTLGIGWILLIALMILDDVWKTIKFRFRSHY